MHIYNSREGFCIMYLQEYSQTILVYLFPMFGSGIILIQCRTGNLVSVGFGLAIYFQ